MQVNHIQIAYILGITPLKAKLMMKPHNEREELVYNDNYDYSAGTHWEVIGYADYGLRLPKGTVKKIIGEILSFSDNPVEIKGE